MVRAAAVKAYTMGLGLRQVAAFLGGVGFSVSRGSIRRWFLGAGELFSRRRVGRGGFIAVDETAQRILPNTQDKDNSDTDKGMDGLKLIVSFHYVCDHFKNY